jgi:hypothetical protein
MLESMNMMPWELEWELGEGLPAEDEEEAVGKWELE